MRNDGMFHWDGAGKEAVIGASLILLVIGAHAAVQIGIRARF